VPTKKRFGTTALVKYPRQEFQLLPETDNRRTAAPNRTVSETPNPDAFRPTACPICSGRSLKRVHRFTAKQAAEAFLPIHRDEGRHSELVLNIEGLWKGPTCDVVQCGACRFTFPIPYAAGDQEFYELAYGVPSYPSHRWEYERALRLIERLPLSDSLNILELGAGVGQFVKALLRIPGLRPDRIVATDYSSHSVKELRKLGIIAHRASVFELAACSGNRSYFDVMCAFQSMEHMANVTEVVLAVKGMLKPGGLAILSVPHGPAIEFNERHLGCFDWPPNHVGRWYRETFAALATKTGLELLTHEIEPRHMSQLLRDAMVFYIHGVSASKPTSVAGRTQAVRNRAVRRILSAAVGSFVLLPLLPAIFRLDSGYSQLAVLRSPK
jgi:2-polyprenyl-3-methyl-5-hydroxy-6-metoxy-1,4-benzoquinol methylase